MSNRTLLFQNKFFAEQELSVWIITKKEGLMHSHSPILAEAMNQVNNLLPDCPLLIMPLVDPQSTGQIIRNIYLLKPSHVLEEIPLIFGMNNQFISTFAGFKQFFTNPADCSHKIMNLAVMQALYDEKNLQMVGVYMPYDEEQPVELEVDLDQHAENLVAPDDLDLPPNIGLPPIANSVDDV